MKWRGDAEMFSVLLAFVQESTVRRLSLPKYPMICSFVFFSVASLNNPLNKHSSDWWYKTP